MVFPVRSGGKHDGERGEVQTLDGTAFPERTKRLAAAAGYKRNFSERPAERRVGTAFGGMKAWLPKTLYLQPRGPAFP